MHMWKTFPKAVCSSRHFKQPQVQRSSGRRLRSYICSWATSLLPTRTFNRLSSFSAAARLPNQSLQRLLFSPQLGPTRASPRRQLQRSAVRLALFNKCSSCRTKHSR
jgi:hypothetical protein